MRKKGYRADGTRIKRPDAARNAKPKKLHVVDAGQSKELRDVKQELDGRTRRGKHERRTYRRLVRAHGGPKHISPELDLLLRSLARIETLSLIASDAIAHSGSVGAGSLTSGSTDALLRAVRELRDLLAHPALASLAMPALAAGRDVVTMSDEELEFLARGEIPRPQPPPARPALRVVDQEQPIALPPPLPRIRLRGVKAVPVTKEVIKEVKPPPPLTAPVRGTSVDDSLAVDRWDSPWRMPL